MTAVMPDESGEAGEVLAALARVMEIKAGPKKVRTPEGVQKYDQPIGSPIVPDVPDAPRFRFDEYVEDGHDVLAIQDEDYMGLGSVEYQVLKRSIRIWHIDAHERRQGIATTLMDELRRRYPNHKFDPLNLTDEGDAFWTAYWSKLENKAGPKKVRTPEGVEKYNAPVGTPITPHPSLPKLRRPVTSVQEEGLDALRTHPVNRQLGDAFERAGHPLFLVGGSVRDAMAGHPDFADLDYTTDATPDEIHAIVDSMGPVWTIGEEFGTVAVQIAGLKTEITTFRTEKYDEASRKPVVAFGDNITDDLRRRDLTINALALTLAPDGTHPVGSLVDPHDGATDLAAGVLRTPDDPRKSMSEDPLRQLRVVRFAAKRGASPEPGLTAAIRDLSPRLDIIATERKTAELRKILDGGPEITVRAMRMANELGVADHLFGRLDTTDETMRVLSLLPADADAQTILAVLAVRTPSAPRLMTEMRLSSEEIRPAIDAARIAHQMSDPRAPADVATARSIVRDATPLTLARAFTAADALGRPGASPMPLRAAVGAVVDNEEAAVRAPLPIDGHDLVDRGMAGPEVGVALGRVKAAFLANPQLTRAQALLIAVPGRDTTTRSAVPVDPDLNPDDYAAMMAALAGPPSPDGRPKAVIFDRDGTLASVPKAPVSGTPEAWREYNAALPFDRPVPRVAALLRSVPPGVVRIMVSGRAEGDWPGDRRRRFQMQDWIAKHELPIDDLFMRVGGDMRRDSIVKNELLNNEILDKFDVRFAVDDRPQVLAVWEEHDIPTLAVVGPDLGFPIADQTAQGPRGNPTPDEFYARTQRGQRPFTGQPGEKMYHSTSPNNRFGIETEGLRTEYDQGEGYTAPGIYMAPLPGAYLDQDVWEVEIGGLAVEPDDAGQMREFQDIGGSYFVETDIPIERLRLYRRAGDPPRAGGVVDALEQVTKPRRRWTPADEIPIVPRPPSPLAAPLSAAARSRFDAARTALPDSSDAWFAGANISAFDPEWRRPGGGPGPRSLEVEAQVRSVGEALDDEIARRLDAAKISLPISDDERRLLRQQRQAIDITYRDRREALMTPVSIELYGKDWPDLVADDHSPRSAKVRAIVETIHQRNPDLAEMNKKSSAILDRLMAPDDAYSTAYATALESVLSQIRPMGGQLDVKAEIASLPNTPLMDRPMPGDPLGPNSGVIPFQWRHQGPWNTRAARAVNIDRVAMKDYNRLDPQNQKRVREAIRALEQGGANIEPKQRALKGTYGVRIDHEARMLVYPHVDGTWHIYAVIPHHDYREAERRMGGPATADPAGASDFLFEVPAPDPIEEEALRVANATAEAAIVGATRYYPTAWIDRSNAGKHFFIGQSHTGRGYYMSRHDPEEQDGLFLGNDLASPSVAVHEIAHRMEKVFRPVTAAEWAFHWRRTSKDQMVTRTIDDFGPDRTQSIREPLTAMSMLTPGSPYDTTELARPDKYITPYIGKDYGDGPNDNYEVLSMGMEAIWTGTQPIWKDAEYRHLIIGLLAAA